jgi:hypothetical protein
MPKGTIPSPRGRARPEWIRPLLPVLALAGLFALSCQQDNLLKPGSVETNVLTAYYISTAEFAQNPIALDGKALEEEWGGPLDPQRAFTMIRMTAEQGSGYPGEEMYVSAKAVYTDTDLYFLFKWEDRTEDKMKDASWYVGPSVPDSGCYVGQSWDGSLLTHNDCTASGGVWQAVRCFSPLVDPDNWTHDSTYDEDRLYVAFEIEPTGDGRDSFDNVGCQVACHQGQNPQFGRPGYGRLDVWEWLAARTNPPRDIYIKTENPDFPLHGIPGYLDDCSAEPSKGLTADPGSPTYYPNKVDGTDVPMMVYRCRDDPPCNKPSTVFYNVFGERMKVNNGVPIYYVWRDKISDINLVRPFNECDIINEAVLPLGQEARVWQAPNPATGHVDAVSGYFYSYASGSRADVRGKGIWAEDPPGSGNGFWTVEIARPLNTGDPVNDVIISFQQGGAPPADMAFAIGVANNSKTNHWGSVPQILRFGVPDGACCLGGGTCEVRSAADCARAGGTYQGNGAACSPNPCSQPAAAKGEGR